jgi:CSLREA domain-containing protein
MESRTAAAGERLASVMVLVNIAIALTLFAPLSYASAHCFFPIHANIIVNTLSDSNTPGDGFCSLREAIANANSAGPDTTSGDCGRGSGANAIHFRVQGTILLVDALPAVRNRIIIDSRKRSITLDGGDLYQVFMVSPGAVLQIDHLIIAHGRADLGGAVLNDGELCISDSKFLENHAYWGGAIYQEGSGGAVIWRSFFSSNMLLDVGRGGAIYHGSSGSMIIDGTTFRKNHTQVDSGSGGAIAQAGAGDLKISNSIFTENGISGGGAIMQGGSGHLEITNSTFTKNDAGDNGAGAIYAGGVAKISASTFVGNRAIATGGAIIVNGSLTVINSTFFENTGYDGGGISSSGTLKVINSTFLNNGDRAILTLSANTVSNSIFFGNTNGNCRGTIDNGGYNISDDTSCLFGTSVGANGQTIGDNIDALLDPNALKDNGGPTQTVALQTGSPAIDAIPIARCPATDQRGFRRLGPGGRFTHTGRVSACDIGAFDMDASHHH